MLIDDEVALREWLVATLEPLCDAEPIALARYVLALVAKDKPLDKLRENCIDRLEVFLDRATKDFVDQLFDVIRNGRYIPEAKKENVQPKASESTDDKTAESSEILDQQNSTSPTKQENDQQQIPTTSQATSSSEHSTTIQQQSSGAIIQPVKRRYSYRSSSGRHHSPNPRRHVNASSGGATRHQISSHYRQTTNSNNQRSHRSSSRSRSVSPPPAKRTQRSYSHSSTGSSSRSSPSRQINTIHQPSTTNTNFLYKKIPCSDFFENKGYCALGDACPYDHGTNAVVFEQQQQQQQQQQQTYYPPYQQYGMPPRHLHPHYHEYNPEAPDLKHGPHQGPPMFMRHPMHHHVRMQGPPLSSGQPQSSQQQMMMNPQRTLVTVVTNAEPLPLEQKLRQNDSMGMSGGPMPPIIHTKRHIAAGPYQNDRRTQQQQQQHEHPSNNDSNNNNNNNNNGNTNHSNTNNGYHGRGWKRPWQKPDGSAPATLEIRKIPVEYNTISKLNEHFSKFGTVTNVQIAYDGSPDCALVAYATLHEAETAYKNPQPLFNNRFIKIFWHNSNKAQSSGNNSNNSNQPTQQQQQQSSSSDVSSTKKPPSNAPNPMKLHWMKMQQLSGNKPEQTATTAQPTPTPVTPTNLPAAAAPPPPPPLPSRKPTSAMTKKDAAKKAVIEIHHKKQGLLEEQIQQQKLLLKKLETAETTTEKESIRSLMKQFDTTIVMLKDSLRLTPPIKSSSTTAAPVTSLKPTQTIKISQQDVLKQRAQTLQKQLETLRAKTSADMRRAMSTTLGQSSLNFSNVRNENDSTTKSSNDATIRLNEPKRKQLIIKNINDLPRHELDEFLKKSGATKIQSGDIDNSLLVTYSSKSDADQIQKNGLTFKDRNLDISFNEDSLLNTSGKKRTLSETMEDELLEATATETTNDDEPETKRKNPSQTSDIDENEEIDEFANEEDRLLADNERSANDNQTKRTNLSIGSHDESNQQYEFDDEVQLLDS